MPTFCQEVEYFISACEALQGLLGRGGTLTLDEKEVIEQCGIELLSKLNPK